MRRGHPISLRKTTLRSSNSTAPWMPCISHKQLRWDGIGAETHFAQPFSKIDENHLWKQGVLCTDSPHASTSSRGFNNGKNFCLKGGEEHRSLKLSQLNVGVCIYGQVRLKNKCVEIQAKEDAGECCHCTLVDMYISTVTAHYQIKRSILCLTAGECYKQWQYLVLQSSNRVQQTFQDSTNHGLRVQSISCVDA